MNDMLWIIVGVVVLVLVFGAGRAFGGKRPESEAPMGRMQDSAPNAVPADRRELAHEIAPLLANNRKIDAIKLVRERTGLGLKEAKEWVESIERR